jgi:ABC-type antimicrobial peptide transport system permease subunit
MYPEIKKDLKEQSEITEILEDAGMEKKYSRSSLYKDAWRRLKKNKLAMIGLGIIIFLIIIAIFAPLVSPYNIYSVLIYWAEIFLAELYTEVEFL